MRQICSVYTPCTVQQGSFPLDLVLNHADAEGDLLSDGEGRFGRLDGHRTLQSSWLSRHASYTTCPQICLSFLFLSLFVSPIAAVPTIEATNSPQQCGTTTLNIDGQAPPFDIEVHIYTQGTRGTSEHFSASSNPASWLTDVAAGTRIQFELSSERHILSQILTVEQSEDDTCIGGTATPPTSTPNSDPATSTSETPPSNPTPPQPTTTSTQPPDVPSPTSTSTLSDTSGQQTSDGDHDTSSSATTDVPSPSQTGGTGSSTTASRGSDPSAGGATSLSSGHATAGASDYLPRGTSATDSGASASGSASPTPTPQTSPGQTSHLALIAGIIAAVLAIICVVVGALYWRYKRRKRARFAIEQFPASVKDLEDRPQTASAHPMATLPTSSKAGMWHSSRSSLLSASSGRGTPSELPSESAASSVLYIHPHALDSVIGQGPTTTSPTSHRESHRILPESLPISKGDEKSHLPSRSPENTRSLNDTPSHRSQPHDVQSIQSYRTYDTPDAAARTPSEPRSAVSEHVVYELDGGVRVAGGPPGRELDARQTLDTRAMALTLPPPYQVY